MFFVYEYFLLLLQSFKFNIVYNMRQIVLLTVVFALLTGSLFAQKVSKEDALKVGLNFYQHYAKKVDMAKSGYNVKDYSVIKASDGQNVIHSFNLEDGGFILVSADMIATPILAYSYESYFDLNNMAPAAKEWVDNFVMQFENAFESKSSTSSEILKVWEDYYTNNFDDSKANGDGVLPLVKTKWGQDGYYNYYCPPVPPNYPTASQGGKCLTGCVATAIAQLMKYYNYPSKAVGYGMYYLDGIQVVPFDDAPYDWSKMPNRLTDTGVANDSLTRNEVARLMFHAGLAVNMNYGPEASGTSLEFAISNPYNPSSSMNPFVQNFGYRGGVEFRDRSLIPTNEWKHALVVELDLKRPVLYRGNTSYGHAFICDGYQAGNFFHFNWGWNGMSDGYFIVDPVTMPESGVVNNAMLFPLNQGMIIRLAPSGSAGTNFLFCNGEVIIPFSEGSFDDGSGPNNYFNNTNCQWLITLDNVSGSVMERFDSLKIVFDKFRLADGDQISVYNGNSSNAPLIGTYSNTNRPPQAIATKGTNLYVSFQADGNNNADGWEIKYSIVEKSIIPTGIEDLTLSNVKLYPNPVSEVLNIDGLAGSSTVTVFDIYGKQLLGSSSVKNNSINVSGLSVGVYFVKIDTEKETKTFKFIKE